MLAHYEVGRISIAPGAVLVTGFGTSWLTYLRPGVQFAAGGTTAVVAEVLDVATLRLDSPWSGPALTNAPYRIDL